MSFPIIKSTAYALIHTPGLMLEEMRHKGIPLASTQKSSVRNFEEVLAYLPNQVFIGNMAPEELTKLPRPWFRQLLAQAKRKGKFGEILPEEEFLALMKAVDVYGLVCLEKSFQERTIKKIAAHPALQSLKGVQVPQDTGYEMQEIKRMIQEEACVPLTCEGTIQGCVKKGHTTDNALTARHIRENLAAKASGVLALQLLLQQSGLKRSEVDYVLEVSEESCGDDGQKGGGGFAKSIAEACSCTNATGSDIRAFCAAPVHGMMQGAALVQAGIFQNVVVVGGGCTAKLGMNGVVHLKNQMPLLEDMLGSFACLISTNDHIHPVIRTDLIGRMKVSCGDSPQNVFKELVREPLARGGYKISQIDRFAAELVNPEIIEPTGCGDVTKRNYQMIASLGVLQGEYGPDQISKEINRFGVPGYAPNQGHIPSGIPFIGHACQRILDGEMKQAMIIGKGSLFLGKLTRLYDALSLIIQKNT
ncbi:glycine/sarcosine/betaine reductase complex component C subunit beta [Dehalobacterium formicoaceticum]|uniref:Glycine/sarcosine/betaine reductase complex component C subunit beta n=1 Tax=Dehalobacterium formicoaceticum TaxID=51515 RepID=A0ABT1Y287_9FIRM|nr:glycine/sarcosine/betaine reductase complex component C subunit beta [Dehalobacterium formicoaceticum]MCR6544965.1 glycine/sarcosine/betaine reductase complex component C subunit beta [Dehalobacterium formicoaceticum]